MIAIYVVTILLGGLVGLLMEKIAVYMINQRVSQPIVHRFSGSNGLTIAWAVINALSWFSIVLIGGLNAKTIECILILSACIIISAVDITIRKVPNEMLLFTLIIGIVFVFVNNQVNSINLNIIGFVVGFIMFFLPTMIGKGAGWGDVKYAAVVGFCLGIYDFLTAVIIMTLILLVYTAYIMITGKGNLKTKIALGPFLASAFVIVLVLNIINSKWMFFNLGVLLNQVVG
jgi:prepilin signal peptidase PulO-like enzyme (type II secretory pathway)